MLQSHRSGPRQPRPRLRAARLVRMVLVVVPALAAASATPAQAGLDWVRTLPPAAPGADAWVDVVVHDSAGRALLVGVEDDAVVVTQLDAAGALSWQSRWPSLRPRVAGALVMHQDSLIVGGSTNGYGGDFFLLRFLSDGSLTWEQVWDAGGQTEDAMVALVPATDLHYYAVGSSYDWYSGADDLRLYRWDVFGSQAWQRDTGLPGGSAALAVDGAQRASVAAQDGRVTAFQSDGTPLWTADTGAAWPVDLLAAPGGQLLHAGMAGPASLQLSVIDPAGAVLGQQAWQPPGASRLSLSAMRADGLGGAALAGWVQQPGQEWDLFFARAAPSGPIDWWFPWDAGGGGAEWVDDLALHPDGKLIASGSLRRPGAPDDDALLLAVDLASGALDWAVEHDGPGDRNDGFDAVAVAPTGEILAAGVMTELVSGTWHYEGLATSWTPGGGPALALAVGPLVRGSLATAQATGAQPGEPVLLAWSARGPGPGRCLPALGGLCLGLLPPVTAAGVETADPAGVASWSIPVPATAPLVPVSFQALARRGLDGRDSVRSNLSTSTVR